VETVAAPAAVVEPPAPPPPPPERTWLDIVLPGDISMKFRLVKPGRFRFGSPVTEVGRAVTREEAPRDVVIDKPFYIGRFEVTQAQYEAVMGKNPSRFRAADKPVEQVSYSSITSLGGFLYLLNRNLADSGHPEMTARLPTEEEWEYACRAGTTSAFSDGSDLREASMEGNAATFAVFGKPFGQSSPVGSLAPNAWGLYDMHGNVEELTDKGVVRGGAWASPARDCRCAARRNMGTSFRGDEKTGFRIVIEIKDAPL
jgi:formylglycine-generating enzyme required for sulfatase activity